MCLTKYIRKIPNPSLGGRTLEPQSSYVTFIKLNGWNKRLAHLLFTSAKQQFISSNAKSKGASMGTQTVISPIPDCGKKGDEADTSHHRAKCLYNIRLGARVFIFNIFPKTKGTPVNNLRHVD